MPRPGLFHSSIASTARSSTSGMRGKIDWLWATDWDALGRGISIRLARVLPRSAIEAATNNGDDSAGESGENPKGGRYGIGHVTDQPAADKPAGPATRAPAAAPSAPKSRDRVRLRLGSSTHKSNTGRILALLDGARRPLAASTQSARQPLLCHHRELGLGIGGPVVREDARCQK
jgi:hypothetical protein